MSKKIQVSDNQTELMNQIKNEIGPEKYYWMLDIISSCNYNQILGLLKLLESERDKRMVLPEYFRRPAN